jgi:hypothetical protein
MQQIVVYSINCISTRFGRLYAHRQESRLRFTAYAFQHWPLPIGEDVALQHALHSAHSLIPTLQDYNQQ